VKLNCPEAIALITGFLVEGAGDDRLAADLQDAGARVTSAGRSIPGMSEVIGDMQVETAFSAGTKPVTVRDTIR
jgi:urease gamma subunit